MVPALGGAERKIGDIFPTGIYYRGAYHQLGRGTLSYSPDGKYLALADKTSATEPFSIFLLALETGERRRLTSPPAASVGDESPAFSPDGTTLALARLVGGAKDIYLVPVAGGEPKRLTFEDTVRPGSFTDGLAWTSDGREIVFASNRSGSFQLWRVPVTGGASETDKRVCAESFSADDLSSRKPAGLDPNVIRHQHLAHAGAGPSRSTRRAKAVDRVDSVRQQPSVPRQTDSGSCLALIAQEPTRFGFRTVRGETRCR